MEIGILVIQEGESISDFPIRTDVMRVSKKLDEYGYAVSGVILETKREKIYDCFQFLSSGADALLITGKISLFTDVLSEKYEFNPSEQTLNIEDKTCILSEECDDAFIGNILIPSLNSRCRTYYATAIFRTFGKTETQLREILKDYVKNRNRIVFKFFSTPVTCDLHIRYSTKTSKAVVDALLSDVTALLGEWCYAYSDVPLEKQVAELLLLRGKKLALAESFTGGGICSALVAFPGISSVLQEGIVCYSNECKETRLNVEKEIIRQYGAVSLETVYEMAANLLVEKRCDIAVATSGNAGPTSEKPNENGVCFIAVGDAKEIGLYPYRFEGDRNTVIQSGIRAALFHLYKLLKQNEFETLLKEQETKIDTEL